MPASPPAGSFAHLHCHTDYSMLDGAARVPELLDRAVADGQPAIAITDHGFMFGAHDFWTQAQKRGIKPVIGLEAYLTPGTARGDKHPVRWGGPDANRGDDVSGGGRYTHMTLWAENNEGMHNLFRMDSLASIEGYYGKPRMDRDLFHTYAKGLIGTTGCPSGEIQTRLRLGQWDEALRAAGEFQDILGKDNYYVEIMDHGLELERRVQQDLLRLAKAIGAKLVATNDLHYTAPEDAEAHEALLCIQTGAKLADPDRFKFDGSGYYLKSAQEMRDLFADFPEACDSTLEIAERCDVEFTEQVGAYMPKFDVPEGEDEISWYVKEVDKGLHRRFPNGIPDEVQKQAEYEIGVVTQKGYAGYYLVVADYINWAKRQGIRVGPGRGSGAGSMTAYAMGITELDPLKNGLIFERFLNPERASMPDFDVDFDERRRDEVIEYITNKYGADHVARIVTFGTIKAKNAIKDASRVLGYPFKVGEDLTKLMPAPVQGHDMPLSAVFDPDNDRYKEAEPFRELAASSPDYEKVVATARGIENLKRQWGVHACGIIMSSKPLADVIPLMRRESDGAIITQFEYPTCESLGLVKMDFLGLRNLTILDDTLEGMRLNGKEPVVLEELPLDDAETYHMLSTGDTLGVFQLDGAGMQKLLRLLRPDNFEDISAIQALYRPGPMGADSHTNYALRKNGLQKIEPLHPELGEALEPILQGTYGLIVYQEQVMEIACKLAGYTLGEADNLRRAMGKKKRAVLDQEYGKFSSGMQANGFSEAAVKALWDVLIPFSAYAFNKAHSAAYGLVSYWTAYLKCHYPVEYMAALLTSVKGDKDKSAVYLAECRRMGITVLPPDVNSSAANFTPVGSDIRFGLTAVRNVGEQVVADIVAQREAQGAYTSFQDFLDKVSLPVCNKRVVESLIKAGGFDSFQVPRRALHMVYEDALAAIVDVKRNQARGQFDLFGDLGEAEAPALGIEIPDVEEWDKKTRLNFEREMLGLYVSDHPLKGLERGLAAAASHPIATLVDGESVPDRTQVTVAGLLTGIQYKTNKQGRIWAVAQIEDLDASIEVLFFPNTYQQISDLLAEDTIVAVQGRLARRDDQASLHASTMRVLALAEEDHSGPVVIQLPSRRVDKHVTDRLQDILRDHHGEAEVHLKLTAAGHETVIRLDRTWDVEPCTELFGDLQAAFGTTCLAA